MSSAARRLAAIAAEIESHEGCGFECCEAATNFVPGEGSPDAEIVFVGEAPGEQEDREGRPFVGNAGRYLDRRLESIGLRRKDVFITNVLKGRPPGNRAPRAGEVYHSWPWLKAQIEAIRPRLIVPLGKHALDCFLPGRKVTADHGRLLAAGGWTYYPTYHPSAALRGHPERVSVAREALREDFERLGSMLDALPEPVSGELVLEPAKELTDPVEEVSVSAGTV